MYRPSSCTVKVEPNGKFNDLEVRKSSPAGGGRQSLHRAHAQVRSYKYPKPSSCGAIGGGAAYYPMVAVNDQPRYNPRI